MSTKNLLRIGVLSATLFSASHLKATEVLLEAKAAFYRPNSKIFREIYSNGGIYGIEASFQAYRGLYPWISADIFDKEGHSIGEHNSTRVLFVPLGLGLKYYFPIGRFADIYLGAGALGTYIHTTDHSPYVPRNHSRWGAGGIGKLGVLLNLRKRIFFDLFTSYSYTKIHFHDTDGGKVVPHDAEIGGWSIGAGLGYRFGNDPWKNELKQSKTVHPSTSSSEPNKPSNLVKPKPAFIPF